MAVSNLARDLDIICPRCGGKNEPEAVFCANPDCRKALGEFRYVLEQLKANVKWHENVADRITRFIGRPHFLAIQVAWVAGWVLLNTGMVALVRHFDGYPFGLLSLILSVEAILITGIILISQNRQNVYDNARAELDYEVNIRTYRLIDKVEGDLADLSRRLERIEERLDAPRA
jgi:uncharacterized membrane protein